jgi:hypothetical protein
MATLPPIIDRHHPARRPWRGSAMLDTRMLAGYSAAARRPEHARRYADQMTAYLGLNAASHVIEVASNDGHLLQYFQARGIPVIGIEADRSAAERATKAMGIPTLIGSFGRDMADRLSAEGLDADLLVANNALAAAADMDDCLAGVARLLNAEGVATFELPRLSRLSLLTTEHLFADNGLRVFDLEPLTPDGPLQVLACRSESAWQRAPRIDATLRAH